MFLADSYVHDLSPYALDLGGGFGIRWYGLSYLTGIIAGWLIIGWFARTGRSLLRPNQVGDFMIWMVVGVVLGGRLGYVLFYSPDLILKFSAAFPFWGVLEINKGGMASHGGILGVIIACLLYGIRHRIVPWHLYDCVAFCAPIGLGLGRVANFINGELPGRPVPASWQADPPSWSVKYPDDIMSPDFANGPQVDAAAVLVSIPPDSGLWEIRAAIRDAVYQGRSDVAEAISPYLTAFYPSQVFQAITDGLLLFIVLALVWLRPKRPGIVGGSFLIAYGLLRIVSEQFRAQYLTEWGVSSIWPAAGLSAVMILIGALVVIWCASRNVPRIGGLLPKGPIETDG